jgi:tRNA uridine 5-carboxymethylaminomethyl modification enzyme
MPCLYAVFVEKQRLISTELERLENTRVGTDTLVQLLRRPQIRYDDLPGDKPNLPEEVTKQVEIAVKYEGYIARQEAEIAKFKHFEEKQIPPGFDYSAVPSLRLEARQKFSKIRPATLGQASRISGVSPADLSILMVWLKRAGGTEGSVEPQSCGFEDSGQVK